MNECLHELAALVPELHVWSPWVAPLGSGSALAVASVASRSSRTRLLQTGLPWRARQALVQECPAGLFNGCFYVFECLSWLLFRAVLLCQFMALRFETCVRCGGAQRLAVLTGTSACLVTKRCGTMVALVAATVPILAAKLRGALW